MATRIRPIAAQLLALFLGGVAIFELLSGRTAIEILIAEIDEVLLAETAFPFNAGRHWFRKRHGDARLIAGQDLLATEVAAIGNGFELVDVESSLCL